MDAMFFTKEEFMLHAIVCFLMCAPNKKRGHFDHSFKFSFNVVAMSPRRSTAPLCNSHMTIV